MKILNLKENLLKKKQMTLLKIFIATMYGLGLVYIIIYIYISAYK